jgi:acyl-coenzyme A synthetase/AMP-(fatty) acid ligase
MHATPLVVPSSPDSILAWDRGAPVTCRRFLSDVAALAELLPDKPRVVNLAENRYRFLVGLAAALVRGHTTLLPPGRAPQLVARIAGEQGAGYCLTDGNASVEGLPACVIPEPVKADPLPNRREPVIPQIPVESTAIMVFTSGSTGRPCAHSKSWGTLVAVAQRTSARFGLKAGKEATIVATVPHQHMYGLETSIMLPLQAGLAVHAQRPLFPADVAEALEGVPLKRILVTTPLHIRACVEAGIRLPEIELILSATAPLAPALAQRAERLFHTQVHEIYGFTEAGSLATRRTVFGDAWQVLDGLSLKEEAGRSVLSAPYFPEAIPFPDVITMRGPLSFQLAGRSQDLINIGGHRASLGDLNQKLIEIDGVEDGVFFLPEGGEGDVTRLMAFAVAPARSTEEILSALRRVMDPVFLPRPLCLVRTLPRNDTGKLTREALLGLAREAGGRRDA